MFRSSQVANAQCFRGIVQSVGQMQKTIMVKVDHIRKERRTGLYVKTSKKFMTHDEYGVAGLGDFVEIETSRPLSKRKHHVIKRIVKRRGQITDPVQPYPTLSESAIKAFEATPYLRGPAVPTPLAWPSFALPPSAGLQDQRKDTMLRDERAAILGSKRIPLPDYPDRNNPATPPEAPLPKLEIRRAISISKTAARRAMDKQQNAAEAADKALADALEAAKVRRAQRKVQVREQRKAQKEEEARLLAVLKEHEGKAEDKNA